MKLRDLLLELKEVQLSTGASKAYICGGAARDRYAGNLTKIADLDITTGDQTIHDLSANFYNSLSKKFNVSQRVSGDGHSTITIGNLKVDFSSNFIQPNIDFHLQKIGVLKPTNMVREIFSRDFTCNALLMSLDLTNIIDLTDRGFTDINNKIIKTCLDPETTLLSKSNRVVRAIYLACKLNFDIDPAIISFVKANPVSIKVSSETSLASKLNSAFTTNPEKASQLLSEMGIWNYIPITKVIYPYYLRHAQGQKYVSK